MQSRNVKNNLGRGFITLVAIATLFFAVAIPSTSFAKPEGEHDKDKEVVLWHKVWDKDKAVDTYLEKFTEDDLKREDDKTPNKKVQKWMKQLEKEDKDEQIDFIGNFIKKPGVEKEEISQPFKMVQALKSVMSEKWSAIKEDKNIADDKKKEAFSKAADKLVEMLGKSDLEKAFGKNKEGFKELIERAMKIFKEKMDDDKFADMTEEEILELIFTDEIKKLLGLDVEAKKEDEEKPKKEDEEKPEDEAKGPTLDEISKLIDDKLSALPQPEPTPQPLPPVNAVGEQLDTSAIDNALNQFCNEDDDNDQFADLIEALNDQVDDLRDQFANVDENDNNEDQALLDALLAGLANQNEDDEDEVADAQQALTPPETPQQAQQPQLADQGEIPQETPQPLPPQPIPPQEPAGLAVDSEPVKAVTAGLRGPSVNFRDGLIAASRGVLNDMKDDLLSGANGLAGNVSSALTPFLSPFEQLRIAAAKKMQAYTQYSEAKNRRDQHERAAEGIRNEMRTVEQGMEPLFAKYNAPAALALQKATSKKKELEDQVKAKQQERNRKNPDGSPAVNGQSVDSQIAQLQQAIRRQEEQIQIGQQAKANFIASQDTSFKDLKAAMEKHEEYASEFGSQVKKFANQYTEAKGEEEKAQLSLQQQQSQQGFIPTVNGNQPFQVNGVNRFNTGAAATTRGVGSRAAAATANTSSDSVRGSLAGGAPR